MPTVDDERLQALVDNLRGREDFANYAIMAAEVRSMAVELMRYRDKPLHCPCCDGDHL